jgi:hypothetical protein
VNPTNEKIRMPRKNKGTYLSFNMSYLMLKKINPKTGKKKKRPKIKLSFAYRFFFFKKLSPGPLTRLIRQADLSSLKTKALIE